MGDEIDSIVTTTDFGDEVEHLCGCVCVYFVDLLGVHNAHCWDREAINAQSHKTKNLFHPNEPLNHCTSYFLFGGTI